MDAWRNATDPLLESSLNASVATYQRAAERGSGGFNWFDSTGKDGDWANMLNHSGRIWKFLPQRYRIDEGWRNDQLDRQGLLVASKLSAVRSASPEAGDVIYDERPDETVD